MNKTLFGRLLALSLAIVMVVTMSVHAEAAQSLYWPVPGHGEVSGTYSEDHPAIDIHDSAINGAAIVAAMGGTVHRMWTCDQQHYGDLHNCSGFGTGMVIQGYDGRFYQYAHMQAGSIPGHLYEGAEVYTGEVIGRVGTTGNSSGYHLHFGISNGASWHPANVNPLGESYIYPMFWPVPACTTISQSHSESQPGITISGPDISGAAVINAAGGEVVQIYNCAEQHYGDMCDCNGYGTGVILKSWDGKYYHYAHLEPGSIPSNVKVGSWIIAESPLGRVGSTGNASGPQLYFAISSASMYDLDVDPMSNAFIYTAATPISVHFGESSRTSIGETSAVLAAILTTSGTSINNVSEVGIELFNVEDGSLMASKREVPIVTDSHISMFYYTDSELGVTLIPDTFYAYRFLAVISGETYYSDMLWVKTTASSHEHSFGEWSVTIEPGCTTEGEMIRTCSCGASEKQPIEATGHSWVLEEELAADCLNPSRRVESCKNCGETQMIFGDVQWSDWSTEYPENVPEQIVEYKTQYRYREMETVISEAEVLDGYELVGTTWLDPVESSVDYVLSWPYGFNSTHGLYAQYNNSPVQAGETAYQKTTELSNQVVGYLYYHWCRGSYTGGPIDRQVKAEYEDGYATFHAFYSTTDPATLGRDGSGQAYNYANGSCCKDSYWYFYVPVYRQTYAVQQLGYIHGRWGEWSEWSFERRAASETCEEESRVVYHYVTEGLGEHHFEDHVCTVCGMEDPDYVPEIAAGWSGNTQWTLTDDGVLTVYGNGNMKNYEYNEARPWADYADRITSVVIEKGVTRVGECAFKGLTNLESVTLPETGLTKIGEAAFYGCTSLKEIYIPDGIYTIWEYVFKNCTSLESIRLPRTLEKIDQGAFENCAALTELYLPGNVNIIGGWSFKACTSLVSVDMQWTDATEIRAGAFKNCTSLTEIILPANIQKLGDSCFYGIGATSFTVPETVTVIEPWCFARASIQEIIFEGDAPVIGEGAFNKITLTAYYPGGNTTWTAVNMLNYGGSVTWKAK